MGNEGNPKGIQRTGEAMASSQSATADIRPLVRGYIPVAHEIDIEAEAGQNYRPLRPGESVMSFDPAIVTEIHGEPHVMTRGAKIAERLEAAGVKRVSGDERQTALSKFASKLKEMTSRPRLPQGRTRTGIMKGHGRYSQKNGPRG